MFQNTCNKKYSLSVWGSSCTYCIKKCFRIVVYLISVAFGNRCLFRLHITEGRLMKKNSEVSPSIRMCSGRARETPLLAFPGKRVSVWPPFLQEQWSLSLWKLTENNFIVTIVIIITISMAQTMSGSCSQGKTLAEAYNHPKDCTNEQIAKSQ